MAAVGRLRLDKNQHSGHLIRAVTTLRSRYAARAANRPYGYGREELLYNLWGKSILFKHQG
jgi:hypothetical protein